MEIIMSYIDSMFAGVPTTEETKRLREDITANMCDKYDELIKDGKSINEAIGTVISEFGNIDEVLTEMGVSREKAVQVQTVDPAEPHRKRIRLYGALAGIGVGMLMIGIVLISPFAVRFSFLLGTEVFGLGFALTGMMMLIFSLLVRTKILVGSVGFSGNIVPFLRAAYEKNRVNAFRLRMIFGGIQLAFFLVFAISDLWNVYSISGTIVMVTVVSAAFAASVYVRLTGRAYGRLLGETPEKLSVVSIISLVSVPFLAFAIGFSKFNAHYDGGGTSVCIGWAMMLIFMTVRVIGEMYDNAREKISEQAVQIPAQQ
ncbi:MAG: hypothetical protein IK093_11935 [Ruminiclostridium sp.]|nr:hypothetical protein [Ruminiclostridium sp.]